MRETLTRDCRSFRRLVRPRIRVVWISRVLGDWIGDVIDGDSSIRVRGAKSRNAAIAVYCAMQRGEKPPAHITVWGRPTPRITGAHRRVKQMDEKKMNGPISVPRPVHSLVSRCAIEMKPMFIPLKAEYFDAFADGSKREELRRYGPRWNERTCSVGRQVVLSKGYGKQSRMAGRIWKFKQQHGSLFGSTYKAAILHVFGTLDIEIACISIEINQANTSSTGQEARQ